MGTSYLFNKLLAVRKVQGVTRQPVSCHFQFLLSYDAFLRETFAAHNKRRNGVSDDLVAMKELQPTRIEDFRRERDVLRHIEG